MSFKELLQSVGILCENQRTVKGICEDHREVKADWLYLARKGERFNGADYIETVLQQKGIVLCEERAWRSRKHKEISQESVYFCDDVLLCQPILLKKLYGEITSQLVLVGVSGTNGKSSVSHLIDRLWKEIGIASMWIGTDGYQIKEKQFESERTTPSLCHLYALFQMALDAHVTHIVMEVSSQAILHKRCEGLYFDAILLNPVTSDHLDEHLTMTQYRYTKFALRRYLKQNGTFILQNDSEENREFYQFHLPRFICVGSKDAHFFVHDMQLSMNGSKFQVNDSIFHTTLLGAFQVMNLSMVIAYGRSVGISMKRLQDVIPKLTGKEGRMQVIQRNELYIVIDYAHTASALSSLLQEIRKIKEPTQRMVTLFGCGGERDHSKRKEMAEIACFYSDEVVVTTDNPRMEPAHQIIAEIIDFPAFCGKVIENRQFALKHILTNAKKHDIILICGRGSEQYQLVGFEKLPYQDQQTVERILEGGFPCL